MLPTGLGVVEWKLDGDAMLTNDQNPAVDESQKRYVPVLSRRTCCSEYRRKLCYGVFLSAFIATAWAGGVHFLKAMEVDYVQALAANTQLNFTSNRLVKASTRPGGHSEFPTPMNHPLYHAPFFTTWFCTTFNAFFYPVYITSRLCAPASDSPSLKKELVNSIQPYQEKGISAGKFLCHCSAFTLVWALSNYLLVQALSLLDATDVIALYATSVVFVYLLSWVLLQEQFVGIRIVAVIVCNTGIALFAYMGRASRSVTLGGVVLAASAATGTAIEKEITSHGPQRCSITDDRYCDLLQQQIIPALQERECLETTVFMQDGAPPRMARPVWALLSAMIGSFRDISRQPGLLVLRT